MRVCVCERDVVAVVVADNDIGRPDECLDYPVTNRVADGDLAWMGEEP